MKLIPSTALVACLALSFVAPAPAQPEKKGAPAKDTEAKRFKFEFREKRWAEVLEWLSDQTGLPIVGSKPAGTFNFVPAAGKTYTTNEIIDILNEALRPTNFKLVRRAGSIGITPIDEPRPESRPIVDVLPLAKLDPTRTVETLRAMFARAQDLYLEADAARRAVIIRGTPDQIIEIKAALLALERDLPGTSSTKVITVERGGAAVLADEIARLIRELRPNVGVRVVAPGKPVEAPKAPAKDGKPLTLTATGNRLIVTCDDPEVLALVNELTRVMTAADAEGDYLVVALRSANASEVAKVLDETFNGPRANVPRRGERLRVVADPASNSLLIKGGPLDLLVVRRLLQQHLDAGQDPQSETRTFLIGPLKHAAAAEMATLLKDLYRGEKSPRGFTATADARTNTLVLRCHQALFEDAKHLVEQLDTPAEKRK